MKENKKALFPALLHTTYQLGAILVLFFKTTFEETKKRCCSIYLLASGATSMLTYGIYCLIMRTFIGTGAMYFGLSVSKHFSIALAEQSTWYHWMTGGVFKVAEATKEELIKNDSFARRLSNMASNSFTNVLQKIIVIACAIIVIAIFVVSFMAALKFVGRVLCTIWDFLIANTRIGDVEFFGEASLYDSRVTDLYYEYVDTDYDYTIMRNDTRVKTFLHTSKDLSDLLAEKRKRYFARKRAKDARKRTNVLNFSEIAEGYKEKNDERQSNIHKN